MADHPTLEVENLVKRYRGTEHEAVSGISFEIRAGQCFGLLGPNGAGKSTAVRCITGFYPPTSGRVSIMGYDAFRQPRLARLRLGVCSQEDTLDTDFSGFDQLVRYASFFRIRKAQAKQRAMALLTQFGLADKAHVEVDALSGGMRRRLQVARALVNDPTLLVLDEPTTGLDPEVRHDLWDVLKACKKAGTAILLTTHYMEEAERLCDSIAMLNAGKILACDTPEGLVAAHITETEIAEEVRPGVIWRRPANVEDVYMKLTGSGLDDDA